MEASKKSGFFKFLDWVERVGNKLPTPFMLFLILTVFIMVLSLVLSQLGVNVDYMTRVDGKLVAANVKITNLFSPNMIKGVITGFVPTYVGFAPLGLVIVMMMGIGLIEETGLISAIMRKTLLNAPGFIVVAALAFIGINANIASDAGMIFSAAIGGALFKALGKNPKQGIIIGFAAASGGFTANVLLAGTDALLAGISQTVVAAAGINFTTSPAMNWYFMLTATFVLTAVTVFVSEKITTKAMAGDVIVTDKDAIKEHLLTPEEHKGLFRAGIAAIIFIAVLLVCLIPKNGFLRGPDGGIVTSPFMSGIVFILFAFFASTGIAYGIGAGVIKKESDIPKLMQKSMHSAAPFLVVALAASLFIDLFNKSGLATVIAVNGANFLGSLNLGFIPLCIGFILLSTFVNLFTISGSAKWLILAPIFIPMFAILGLSPALTQTAYRIGDSATNIISPLSPYIPVVIGIFDQYKREEDKPAGFGTIISYALPYSIAYLIVLTLLLCVWILLSLPVGPGAPLAL